MQFRLDKMKNMPFSAKVGTSLWLFSWIWFLATYYYLTKDDVWVLKLSIAVGLLAIFLIQAQNWSRLISVLGSCMGLLITILFFSKGFLFIAAVNLILFGGAIYFLMVPSTSAYFKSQSPKSSQPDVK